MEDRDTDNETQDILPDINFICGTCNKKFKSLKSRQLHEEWHFKWQFYKFICKFCAKKVKTEDELKNHLEIHEGSFKSFRATGPLLKKYCFCTLD